MARSYLDRPLTQIRRRDRALDEAEWVDRFLGRAPVGHLALCRDGQPLLHSNLFWYDGDAIYFHTAGVGRLRAVLDAGPAPACFSVSEFGRLLPAATPFDFSTEYASVVLYGTIAVVPDLASKRRALEGVMQKYAGHLTPGVDYPPMPNDDVASTSVYRLAITERAAKHNVKPADYPAYDYPGESFIAAERAAGRVTVRPKDVA